MNKRIVVVAIPIVLEIIALLVAAQVGPQAAVVSGDSSASFAVIGNVLMAVGLGFFAGIFAIVSSVQNGGNPLGAFLCILFSLICLLFFSLSQANMALAIISIIFFAIPMRKVFI